MEWLIWAIFVYADSLFLVTVLLMYAVIVSCHYDVARLEFICIKMFSFVGESVLDPFLGSGTTSKAARELSRNSIGYEINKDFLPIIEKKIGKNEKSLFEKDDVFEIIFQEDKNVSQNKVKNNSATLLNNRINHPEYWKQLKNAER